MSDSTSPAFVYAARFAARRATAATLNVRFDQLSYARLGMFMVALVVAGIGFGTDLLSPWFTLIPVAAFIYLVAKFEATRGRITWAERAAAFYTAGIDRLEGKPGGISNGANFADENHPYAADLDLFGPGSLFERLTACRTQIGESTLAAWLGGPAIPAEVKARQEAVDDLKPRIDLRESVAVAGANIPAADCRPLAAWGTAPADPAPQWKRWTIEVLGWGNVLAVAGWLFVGTTSLPVVLLGLPSLILAVPLLPWARRVLAPLERTEHHLSLLESILARLEREPFSSPRLKELQAGMLAGGLAASAQIRALRNILTWYDSRRNAMFIPIAILRMWDIRFAYMLEQWRARSGVAVGHWLRVVGEVEALSSLAGYAYENPTDVFPTVEAGPVRVVAVGVGHPLIPLDKCVRNDVKLGGEAGPRILLISGSNMSGKSTLLRAVGVNAVLALMGGVVRADSLTLTPLALGATMRVQDSLQAGRSRFFAEVTKVRQLLDLAKPGGLPLLFLLDEIFSGTNSADRVAGAEGVVRTLLAAGAIGFVTTHDLSLTGVAERLPGTVNVHFCDGFAGGELKFDYTMREGVVPHGNGLALMRAVGLEV